MHLNLTQTIFKLLEKEENQELVNKSQKIFYVQYTEIELPPDFKPRNVLYFNIGNRATGFGILSEMEQLYVIRACLECLPFFERENPECVSVYEVDMKHEYIGPSLKIGKNSFGILSRTNIKWLKSNFQPPKTLKAKYQARLFLPIPDLDKEFEGEGITEEDLK